MAAKYVTTVVLITCMAAGLALGIRRIRAGRAPRRRGHRHGCGRAVGAVRALYTAREDGWFPCCPPDDEDDEEEEESAVADALTKISACCDCVADEEEPLLKTAEERRSERDILVVAFLGTMDDLVVYFLGGRLWKIPASTSSSGRRSGPWRWRSASGACSNFLKGVGLRRQGPDPGRARRAGVLYYRRRVAPAVCVLLWVVSRLLGASRSNHRSFKITQKAVIAAAASRTSAPPKCSGHLVRVDDAAQ